MFCNEQIYTRHVRLWIHLAVRVKPIDDGHERVGNDEKQEK